MKKLKIGFLPLFIELYDRTTGRAASRDVLEPYYEDLAKAFESKGVEVVRSGFCRLKNEFAETVKNFEGEKVDCIVTLHLAYSPSLECIDTLASTKLPIVVCDTTTTYDFSPETGPANISYCHGIHGVMDMCSLLIQRGKPFAIAAGHAEKSDVLDKVIGYVKAARAAITLDGSTVGTIGGSFDGMGDFLIDPLKIKEIFGVSVIDSSVDELKAIRDTVTEDEIKAEYESNCKKITDYDKLSLEDCKDTIISCLTTRKWIEKHEMDAFTVNFLNIGKTEGIAAMPFMEACMQMEKGIGYAGEGDILTSAITGSLMRGFTDASFIEIFSPDWKNGNLLLSHMGEMNYALASKPPKAYKIKFVFGKNAVDPVVSYAGFKAGKAVYVNICKDAEKYNLVISPVEMLSVDHPSYDVKIRGWMKPCMPIERFLEAISMNGATHHSSLIYGATVEELEFYAKLIGVNPIIIR